MRTGGVAAVALAIAAAAAVGGCGKKGGGDGAAKPLAERKLVHQTPAMQGTHLELDLPDGMKGGVLNASALHYTATGDDTLDVSINTGVTPIVLQNEVNAVGQTELRVTRSEATGDGWVVTSGSASGDKLINKRMIKVDDTHAVMCQSLATWKNPEHSQKRIDFVEAICKSLTVKPQ